MGTHRTEQYTPLLRSFPDSEKLNSVSERAEVLYLRLLAKSDDANHYWGEPRMILAKLFTHRMVAGQITEKDVANRLGELCDVGLARLYAVDGRQYLELLNCFKKLRADVQPKLAFPQPLTQSGPDAGRMRADAGPDTGRVLPVDGLPIQPNPTQSNPKKLSRPRFSFSDEDMATAEWMHRLNLEIQPSRATPSFNAWANAIRLMRERDKRTDEQIRELYQWCHDDGFWSQNVLSPTKLREKWDDLQLRRRGKQAGSAGHHSVDFDALNIRGDDDDA